MIFVSLRKNKMATAINIREEVNHYLKNVDERMLKIGLMDKIVGKIV